MLPLLAGCSTLATADGAGATATLVPYRPGTPTPTPGPIPDSIIPLATPAPTPTPLTHAVLSGDTLMQIALDYGVSLDDLLLANPGIDPGLLTIGQAIRIPGPEGEPVGALAPTPTPIALDFGTPTCYRTPAGASWCLVLVTNRTGTLAEGVVAEVTLVDRQGNSLASGPAVAPVNLLPPEASLPLAAYFGPTAGAVWGARFEPVSALGVGSVEGRYLELTVSRQADEPSEDRLLWRVTGSVSLADGAAGTADRLVVLLVAYGEGGELAGFAVRQLPAGLAPGTSTPFDLTVFSLGPPITRVELLAEAQPPAEPAD